MNGPDSALIPLTKGCAAIVDIADYDFLMQWKWHAYTKPKTKSAYAVRTTKKSGKKETIWMHRLINSTPSGLFTVHINGNGLDNRRVNLRTATHQENMVNCARWKSGSSKYRGVSWHVSNKRWVAQITVNYKNIYIGAFATELEAKEAYDTFRKEIRRGQIIREDVI